MVRIEYAFHGDAFADGAGNDRFLMDLSEGLSSLYSRKIAQGQIFKIRAVEFGLRNPNTAGQDEMMAVAGRLIWFTPTSYRKKAWKVAKNMVAMHRRTMGIAHSKNYDFRVGLITGYSTDVGAFGEGVKHNAWVNADDDPLLLACAQQNQGIFKNWNDNHGAQPQPQNPTGGFGHWAQKDADAIADELDFTTNEATIFYPGQASETHQSAPFAVGFSNVIDSALGVSGEIADTQNHRTEGPLSVMCGLLGIYVDTTLVDDTETQNQDWTLVVSVDVESWSPIKVRL